MNSWPFASNGCSIFQIQRHDHILMDAFEWKSLFSSMMKSPVLCVIALVAGSLLLAGCQSKSKPANQAESPSTGFEDLVQTFENSDRDDWQDPDRVIDQLGTLTGKTVADIGAGTGYFTFRILPKAQRSSRSRLTIGSFNFWTGRQNNCRIPCNPGWKQDWRNPRTPICKMEKWMSYWS